MPNPNYKAHFTQHEAAYRAAIFDEAAKFAGPKAGQTFKVTRNTRAGPVTVGKLRLIDGVQTFCPADGLGKIWTFADVLFDDRKSRTFQVDGKPLTWLVLRADWRLPTDAMLFAANQPSPLAKTSSDLAKLIDKFNLDLKGAGQEIELHLREPFVTCARSITLVVADGVPFISVVPMEQSRARSFRSLEQALVFANVTPVARMKKCLDMLHFEREQPDTPIGSVVASIRSLPRTRRGSANFADLNDAVAALEAPADVNVSAVLVGAPSAGKSTVLQRLLTRDADGTSPVCEGIGESDNTKLPIRYECAGARGNAVLLKFCNLEALRERCSKIPDSFLQGAGGFCAKYAGQECVVMREWLTADAQAALGSKQDEASQLELSAISAVVRGIVRTVDAESVLIDIENKAYGRAFLAAVDFVVVQCETCAPSRVYWDTPGLTGETNAPVRRLDSVVNEFVWLWRGDNGALTQQLGSVCDVVMQFVHADSVRKYVAGNAQELLVSCGLFGAVARGLDDDAAALAQRAIQIKHRLYAHVNGAPQLVIVYPKVGDGNNAVARAIEDVHRRLDALSAATVRDEVEDAIVGLAPPDSVAVDGMPLLGRHFGTVAHLLCLPKNDIALAADRVKIAKQRVEAALTAAACKWSELRLFRAMVDVCRAGSDARSRSTTSEGDVLALSGEQLKRIDAHDLAEFDAIDGSLPVAEQVPLFVDHAVDMAVTMATEVLSNHKNFNESLSWLLVKSAAEWRDDATARLMRIDEDNENDVSAWRDQLEDMVYERVPVWVRKFLADGNAIVAASTDIRKLCETGIRALEKQLGCVQSTAADAFAAPKRGGELEDVASCGVGAGGSPLNAMIANLIWPPPPRADDGGDTGDDRGRRLAASQGGEPKRARTSGLSLVRANDDNADDESDGVVVDCDAGCSQFFAATVSAADSGRYNVSFERAPIVLASALPVFVIPLDSGVFAKTGEGAAAFVRVLRTALTNFRAAAVDQTQLIVVLESADELEHLRASSSAADDDLWAVCVPRGMLWHDKLNVLLALAASLGMPQAAILPWQKHQTISEFRFHKFSSLPQPESLARVLLRMKQLLEFEQRAEFDAYKAGLIAVADVLQRAFAAFAAASDDDADADTAAALADAVAEARKARCRDELQRLVGVVKSNARSSVKVVSADGRAQAEVIVKWLSPAVASLKRRDDGLITHLSIDAAALAARLDAPMPVAAAIALPFRDGKHDGSLMSHSNFRSCRTNIPSQLGLLLADVGALCGAGGGWFGGERWATCFPHLRLFKLAEFKMSSSAKLFRAGSAVWTPATASIAIRGRVELSTARTSSDWLAMASTALLLSDSPSRSPSSHVRVAAAASPSTAPSSLASVTHDLRNADTAVIAFMRANSALTVAEMQGSIGAGVSVQINEDHCELFAVLAREFGLVVTGSGQQLTLSISAH